MQVIEVAVGVIVNGNGEVLISRRQAHQHQGNLWEFPGGKREPEESWLNTLRRELAEEVGLSVQTAENLLVIEHAYDDRMVKLNVWLVEDFTGDAIGLEGQQIHWCPLAELQNHDFPAANSEIITAIQQHYHT